MIDAREWQQIRREIRNSIQSLFFGFVDSTQINDVVATEAIQSLVPGMPTIGSSANGGRPVVHPYGFYSRARPSTDSKPIVSVVMRQNEDPSALFVVGHRDSQRPSLDDDGDVILYDANGHTMKLSKSDGVTIDAGSDNASVSGAEVDITATSKAVIDSPEIDLTKNPTDALGLSSLIHAELVKISTALSGLTAPPGGGPVTGNTYLVPGNVGSTKVKAS